MAEPEPVPPAPEPEPEPEPPATEPEGVVFDGSDQVDDFDGTDGTDRLIGAGGDDTLAGLAGNDTLIGGPGADILSGGDGDDLPIFNVGDSVVVGGNGDDTIRSVIDGDTARNDAQIFPGSGADVIQIVEIDSPSLIVIFGFEFGVDKVDLSELEIVTGQDSVQLGETPFSTRATITDAGIVLDFQESEGEVSFSDLIF